MKILALACWYTLLSVVISFPTTSKPPASVTQPHPAVQLQESQKDSSTAGVVDEVKELQEHQLVPSTRPPDVSTVQHASKLPVDGVSTASPSTQTGDEASVSHIKTSVKLVDSDGTPPSPNDKVKFVTDVPSSPEVPSSSEVPFSTEVSPSTEVPPSTGVPPSTEVPPSTKAPPSTDVPPSTKAPPFTDVPPTTKEPPTTEVPTSAFSPTDERHEITEFPKPYVKKNQTKPTSKNETKPERPDIALSGIVDDVKDFGAVNDAVEIVKDVTTLLSEKEKNDQKRHPSLTDVEQKEVSKTNPSEPSAHDENENDSKKAATTPSVPREEHKLESVPHAVSVNNTKPTVNENVKTQRSIMTARSPTKNSRGTTATMHAESLNLDAKLPKLHKIDKREETSNVQGKEKTDPVSAMKPDVAKPQVAGPEVAQPEVTEPEVAGPKVSESEEAKPEVTQTENTRETVPEVLKPEVTQTENAMILKPDASKDELVRPNDVTTEVTKPEVPKPQFAKPEVSELKSTKPEASKEETVESSSETAQSGALHPETLQTEAPQAEIVPLKTLEEDVAKPETDQPSEVQSELLPPAAGQQQAVPKIPATVIPATNVAVPAKNKDSASESTQNMVAGSAPQAVANQTLSTASPDGVTGVKNETTSGGSSGFDPFSAIRAIARPVINAVTTVRDTIRPVFGAALSPIVGPSSPGKGDGEGAQKAPNATQPPFQGTETPSDVPSKQPNGKGAESPEETTILPDKQNESLATTTSPLVPDKVAAEPKIAESNPSSSETVIPTGDVSKNASQSQSGLPGLPFDPTTTIKRLTQPAINVATAVRDRVKPVFDAAVAPVVDVISPGKESGVGNQTLEVQKQPEDNKEAAPSFTEAPKEPEHSTEDIASSTKSSKEQEQSAEMSKLPKSTHEDTSNSTETPKEQGKRLYSNYKLFTTFVGNDTAALAAVSALQEIPEVDFWNIPTLNRNVTFLVPPGLVDKVTEDLTKAGLKLYVLTNDIQSWLDRERDENRPGVFFDQRDISNFAYDKYHRVEEITGYLDLLAQKYSNIATVRSIGMTQEGRPIKGIILSTGGNRPVIWLDGGIHAREWISPASLVYLLGKMTSGYGSDSTITGLMQAFDFYVFPVVNPDGYAYTFHADRLWRKNRSGGKQGCRGVDPNRNFAASFGGPGTSSHPCSDIYRGSAAFSETESRAIRDALVGLGSRTKAYVTVHSYSQLIMVPYGHGRGTYTKDYADQIAAARAISRAIQVKSGVYYQVGTISSLLGSAAGSSTDWVYDSANIKYSLAVELRDKGRFGFLLPNFLIVPTSDEFTEGVKALGKFIARRELNKTIQ